MDQSHTESDISLSPSQILDRLKVLRHIQLLQRGKLQKHRLQYENSPEISSNITEIVSHFSNSTSYNTFRSLLDSSEETPVESPHSNVNNSFRKENLENVVEGVSLLNLSEESEFIANSVSPRSLASARLDYDKENLQQNSITKSMSKKQISLDDIPILSPKKDFETLVAEKLKNDKNITNIQVQPHTKKSVKKTFLKKGEGTARFGVKKNDLVIQNTKSLPWKKNKLVEKNKLIEKSNVCVQNIDKSKDCTKQKPSSQNTEKKLPVAITSVCNTKQAQKEEIKHVEHLPSTSDDNSATNIKIDSISINLPKGKHPLRSSKEKTWASVFTKEQDDFLRQLKQSDYYKNFVSPSKSIVSDTSCNENLSKLKREREIAEQNLFELIENKVTHESFSIDNSFFNRFLKNNNLECSGESTPLVMQKCLYKNPNLMHILPDLPTRSQKESICNASETCNSECSECNDDCSTVSSCCSCHTTQENNTPQNNTKNNHIEKGVTQKVETVKLSKNSDREKEKCQNDISTCDNETMNSNMAEMNAKLIATSELLKDRLRELEDEIETFRQENSNLSKMREEIDLERKKFYEEKSAFEQKFNEEKVLSEYYLAEEKEKLTKQKQMYERYVRDMRGRLSKKEKDEVINLKKEISDLKDEIRIKDAKSTSTIARLRNQLKLIEKDKKNLEEELEKLKKENKRIQHSNEITRRLTNLKYLEQINKKLANMTSRDTRSDVDIDSNMKYKAYEIERQSRTRRRDPIPKGAIKQRAKSVPNLHVTSRYAKYFSQKDSLSNKENIKTLNDDPGVDNLSDSDAKSCNDNSYHSNSNSDNDEENNLEKLYNERFKSISPQDRLQSSQTCNEYSDKLLECNDDYFLTKSNRSVSQNSGNRSSKTESYLNQQDRNNRSSKSPTMPFSRLSNESKSSKDNSDYVSSYYNVPSNRNKSPVSILSNRSSSSIKLGTVINKEISDRLVPSPEPTTSKTSLTRTNLNPTEIRMPDGTKELRFPNGNVKFMSADGKYSKFLYYNGDIKENFYDEGRIKYYYAETKTFHTTQPDGLEILEFPDGQVEKRYKDGSSEIRLPNGSIRYYDPKNEHVREEWRFPDGAALTVAANGEQRIVFANGQVEVHAKDHKRREFPDGSVKLLYNDGTAETRYASGRVRIKDKLGNLIMDSAPG